VAALSALRRGLARFIAAFVEDERGMAIAIALALVVVGSVVFHFVSPWWWTPIASNWGYIDDTIIITFWITGAVFAAVVLFMAYCVLRFRHREGHHEAIAPPMSPKTRNSNGGSRSAPALASPPCSLPASSSGSSSSRCPGTLPPSRSSASNGSGATVCRARTAGSAQPTSPMSHRRTRSVSRRTTRMGRMMSSSRGDQLHLPLGKPVKLLLRSLDVLHNFYVPEFRAKMDMIPGAVTYYWLTPTRVGTFEALCAELCSTGHAFMRGGVVVEPESGYQAWLQQQKTFAQLQAPSRAQAKN
jgi:cytochrome c oxidase subunit 2